MTTSTVDAMEDRDDTYLRSGRKIRFQKLRVLGALVLREMSARYGRSVGGYFWAVAEPAGGIVLLALVFSFSLFRPPLGNSFMVFYATGIIPFYMYNSIASNISAAVQSNRGLLTYPAVSALDTVFARLILETLNYMMIALVLFPVLIHYDNAIVSISYQHILMSMLMAAVMGLGVGTVNAVIIGFFPTWKHLWGVLNRPLFILSGVMFTYGMIPMPMREYMWYNPLVHVIGQMRMGFYGTYEGDYISWPYVFGIAATLFVTGGFLMRRNIGKMIER